ncbi:MAG: hypothetical protein JNK82_30660 [Myxococcaceae bacterium]|nr:hypothetical protein [Myxococcaceae bacterium]
MHCIARDGIDEVNVDAVGRELCQSRAHLYRRFGDWQGLLRHVHGQVLRAIDAHVPLYEGDAGRSFGTWWQLSATLLRADNGRAFRALRGRVAGDGGVEELAVQELGSMPTFVRWFTTHTGEAGDQLRALQVWLLLLAATPFPEESEPAMALREAAWGIVERGRVSTPAEEPDPLAQ